MTFDLSMKEDKSKYLDPLHQSVVVVSSLYSEYNPMRNPLPFTRPRMQ